MHVNWKTRLLWALALTVVLSTTTVALAGKGGVKGKPGGEDPPPEPVLPPIRYEVQYFTVPTDIPRYVSVRALNDLGQAVGNFYPVSGATERHGYLFDPAGLHIPVDLYDPAVHANQAIDLNTIGAVGIPTDWHIGPGKGDITDFRPSSAVGAGPAWVALSCTRSFPTNPVNISDASSFFSCPRLSRSFALPKAAQTFSGTAQ